MATDIRALTEVPRRDPTRVAVLYEENAEAEMAFAGGVWRDCDVSVSLSRTSGGAVVNISAESCAICAVTLIWDMSLPAEALILGDAWERGYGDLGFRGYDEDRALPWYCMAVSGNASACIGVKTGCAAFCSFRLTRDRLALTLNVQNGGSGVLLNGRTLDAAELIALPSREGETPYALLKRFCASLCDRPLMPGAPVYGGNNWYYAYGDATAAQLVSDSAFIASLAPDADNRPFMFVDDGWQVCRNRDFVGGPWHEGNRAFPDMPGLAAKMRAEGVRPGLWIRPLMNAAGLPWDWRLPEGRFLKRELGGEFGCFLDPSIPDVLRFIELDIARIVGWGFEAVKHDYTTYDLMGRWGVSMNDRLTNAGWRFADRGRTTMEIILTLYAAIRRGAGDALLLGCNTVSHASAGFFEMQRTGDDTSGTDWARTRKMGVNTLAFRAAQHGALYAADADCVGITDRIPWALNRRWLELVSGSGTPLLVSADPKTATPEQKADLRRAFAKAAKPQPLAEPLDWLTAACPTEYRLMGETARFRWEL